MSGGIVALVPLRSLTGGKTRLAGVLSPGARALLTREMVTGVVRSALASDAIASAIVVSPDPEALRVAARLDRRVLPVQQPTDRPGLLAGLDVGRDAAEQIGAAGLLTLFGDLPLLTGADVRNLTRRAAPVVIAPDRHGGGTNALLLRFGAAPACERFAFQFGEGSYRKHVAEAHRLGLDVTTSISAGTAFDLDTPNDLSALLDDPRWAGSLAADRARTDLELEWAS